jgi:Outer membrane protein beta-barrel family/Carboxypeptidase regulatory-like domain
MRLSAGIIVCLLFVCSILQAQRTQYGQVKGTVIDSTSRLPLEAATMSAFLVKDSALVNYALTNRKGEFVINNIPIDKPCWLMVSYNGYATRTQNFIIPADKKELSLGFITIRKSFTEMAEVTVVAQRPPVLVRQDTMEFNSSSFKTAPNAILEDILKQLPGFEIDQDGNITVNGKKVTRLTIEGKEFFGGDPKIALKNLPKEIIDKIQVADNKTREAKFNKRSTGNEDLAINLTLRKEIKQGWFGRINGGYGSEDRYESMANINFLKGTRQLNIIGNANNTSRGGSSGGDFSISNGRNTLSGGGTGFTDSKAAGANYSDNFGNKIVMSGSYFYNQNRNSNVTQSRRQNILPDTSFFYNSANKSTNIDNNHRLSLNVDYNIDSLTELHVNSSVGFNKGNTINSNTALSEGISGNKINSSDNIYSSRSNGSNITAGIFLGHRFKKMGRGITVGFNYSYNDRKSTDDNIGQNIFFKPDSVDIMDSLNQRSATSNSGNNFSFNATYSEPLFKKVSLFVQYAYTKSSNASGKYTSSFNAASGKYDKPDSAFTNAFKNNTETHTPGVSLAFSAEKLQFSIGSGLQWFSQDNYTITNNNRLVQHYLDITPNANIGYNFSKTGSINIYYNGRSQQPSIDQLQPVPDNSNPLYIRLGNPDLSPSFYHSIYVNMRHTNGTVFWFGGFNFNTTSNQVIYETFYDDVGRQVSKPVNINGNYRVSGNVNFTKTWKHSNSSLRLNLGSNGSIDRNQTFTNKVMNISNGFSLAQSLGMSYTYKQLISILPTFNIRYNKTRYSVKSIQSAEYLTKGFAVGLLWNYPKRLIIENSVQYAYNDHAAPGFRKGVTMWSAAVDWQVFKNQKGAVRLAVYDILKQNAGVYRSVTETYIEDRQSQVLQQYFLLSFIYNLRDFGK